MFTHEELVAKVREAAQENPGHIYQRPPHGRCEYWDFETGDCGCLVGAGLKKLGVTHTSLPLYEWQYGIVHLFTKFVEYGLVNTDCFSDEIYSTVAWLARVQGLQDDGHPWLSCVQITDEEMDESK